MAHIRTALRLSLLQSRHQLSRCDKICCDGSFHEPRADVSDALLHQMPGLNISLPCRASRLCSTSTRSALTNDRCSHDEPETNLRPLHGRNTPARRGRGALCRAGRCGLQSNAGRISDPAPQRFEVAQAQTGGGSTLPGGASSLNEIRASPKNNIVSTTCGVELSLQRLCSAGGTRYEQRSR